MDSVAKVYRRNTLEADVPSIENFIIKIVHLLSRINDSPLSFIFPIFTLYQEQRKNVIQRLIARILVVIVNICIKNRKTLSQRYDIPYRLPLIAIYDHNTLQLDTERHLLCVIIDLYARMVVGFRIGLKNSTRLVKSTFKLAYEQRQPQLPLLFRTDRGSNYRSNAFCAYLQSLGVTQSFSRAHVPYDNSVMESFFASMKREELYRTKYRSEQELRAAAAEYIKFYNETRPHAKKRIQDAYEEEQELRKFQAE